MMTLEQRSAIEALAKISIYYPGRAKRFQCSLKEKLLSPDSKLSASSWKFAKELLHTYRRQVPHHLHRRHCPNPKCQKKMAEREALQNQLEFAF